MVLEVSRDGSLLPHSMTHSPPLERGGIIHALEDCLTWLGDDLATLRTFDVLRALDMIGQWPGLDPKNILFHAHGRHGLFAQLATGLDRRVKHVEGGDRAICRPGPFPSLRCIGCERHPGKECPEILRLSGFETLDKKPIMFYTGSWLAGC